MGNIIIDKGYTDTPIDGVTSLALERRLLNLGADFRVKQNGPNELVLTNLTSPVDRPETIRIARSEVSDIYKNTDIAPAVQSPSKRGINLLIQINQTVKVSDSVDADFVQYLPVSFHAVAKFPATEYFKAADLLDLLGGLCSIPFDTGSDSESRLAGLMRGSLVPKDV